MKANLVHVLLAGCLALWGAGALAQDAPALKDASAQEQARLRTLIEAAKKEGALSYWDTIIQPETHDALSAAFRKQYGLPNSFQINYTLSVTTNLITRVEQEAAANQVTIDVGAVAAPTWLFERVRAGDFLEYESPEYKHYEQIFQAGLGDPRYFAVSGAYMFVPMWNEDFLKFDGRSYRDALKAVPAGRISIGDATKSASFLNTFIGQKSVLDPDFFRSLAQLKPSFLVRSEQHAARLVTGEDLMAFSGMPTRAYQNNQKGARLKFMLPQEGVVLMPQGSFIMKKARHPNAAKLWTDFILSEQGQTIMAKGEALISGRSGFKSPLPDYAPSIDSLKLIKVDWKGMTTQEVSKLRQEWVSIFNP